MRRFGDTRLLKLPCPWNPGQGSLKVIEGDTIRSLAYGFLLPSYSNFVSKMHRFRDMTTHWSKIAEKTQPTLIWHVPLGWPLAYFSTTRGRVRAEPSLQLGTQTVNTYSKPPLYYTLGAVAPLLPCLRTAARHTHSGLAALCRTRTDRRATDTTYQPANQPPTSQPTGQQPFCQYPAVSWELAQHLAVSWELAMATSAARRA